MISTGRYKWAKTFTKCKKCKHQYLKPDGKKYEENKCIVCRSGSRFVNLRNKDIFKLRKVERVMGWR